MKLTFSKDCPLFSKSNEPALQRVLGTIQLGWHTVVAPSPEELEQLVPPYLWDIYGELLLQSYKVAINSKASWVIHTNCSACKPDDVAEFCNLPTLLMVENAQSDGRFVATVATKLRPGMARYFRGANPRISILQAGGIGELPKELARYATRYSLVRPAGTARLRIVVFADSDALVPSAPSPHALAVAAAAVAHGAAYHLTSKRAIENYIPDRALQSYAEARSHTSSAVGIIVSLGVPARDHYSMKAGLNERDIQTGLYPSGTPEGVGLGDFIVDFLENFSYTLESQDLQSRDGHGELEAVLDLLEENL